MYRPTGVTVLGVLYAVGAGFMFLLAIAIMVGGSLAGGMLGSLTGQGSSGTGAGTMAGAGIGLFLGVAGGVFLLLISAAHVALAWGMFKLKEWARVISIVLAVLGVIGGTLGLLFGVFKFSMIAIVFSLVRLAIAGIIAWYLMQPHVKNTFRGSSAVPVQV